MSLFDYNLTPIEQEAVSKLKTVSGIGDDIEDYVDLYNKKLWHQLQLKIDQCFEKPEFLKPDVSRTFYDHFIVNIGLKINVLKYAQYSCTVAGCLQDDQQAIHFLQDCINRLQEAAKKSVVPFIDHSIWYIKAVQTELKVKLGQLQEGKALVEELVGLVEKSSKVDPQVTARIYQTASLYYKSMNDYASFYRSSLQYLCFVQSESLSHETKMQLAVDISLAALLGVSVYNFGELLLHPVVSTLKGSQYDWLLSLLHAFTDGDMVMYEELCEKFSAELSSQPGLVANQRLLKEKITIMSLLELVHSQPPQDRNIPLAQISARVHLDQDGAEFLVMKAASLKLLSAKIDQVEATVQVSWVLPRVLTLPQLAELTQKLEGWQVKVESACQLVQQHTEGFVEG